jgi:hypothetical protein
MLSTLVALLVLATSPNVSGVWNGIFNGQPEPGSSRETRTPFRLRLQFDNNGRLRGTLTVVSTNRTRPIANANCDIEGCSFEVGDRPDDDSMAWRVAVDHGKLVGYWTRGLLGGMGLTIGARLFQIEAKRESSASH